MYFSVFAVFFVFICYHGIMCWGVVVVVVGVVGCRRPWEGGILGVREDAQEEYQMSALCTWGGGGGVMGMQELHKRSVRCVQCVRVLGVGRECRRSVKCLHCVQCIRWWGYWECKSCTGRVSDVCTMYSVLDGLRGVGVVRGVQRLHRRSVRCALCVQCAGGLGDGLGVRECAWKECEEEASIDEELLEDLKSVGVVRCVFLPHC